MFDILPWKKKKEGSSQELQRNIDNMYKQFFGPNFLPSKYGKRWSSNDRRKSYPDRLNSGPAAVISLPAPGVTTFRGGWVIFREESNGGKYGQ